MPCGIYDPPPCKGLLYFKSNSAFQLGDRPHIVWPASLPFNNLEGLNEQ